MKKEKELRPITLKAYVQNRTSYYLDKLNSPDSSEEEIRLIREFLSVLNQIDHICRNRNKY